MKLTTTLIQNKKGFLEEGLMEYECNNEDSGKQRIRKNHCPILFVKVIFYFLLVVFMLFIGWISLMYFVPALDFTTGVSEMPTYSEIERIDYGLPRQIDYDDSNSITVEDVSSSFIPDNTMTSTQKSETEPMKHGAKNILEIETSTTDTPFWMSQEDREDANNQKYGDKSIRESEQALKAVFKENLKYFSASTTEKVISKDVSMTSMVLPNLVIPIVKKPFGDYGEPRYPSVDDKSFNYLMPEEMTTTTEKKDIEDTEASTISTTELIDKKNNLREVIQGWIERSRDSEAADKKNGCRCTEEPTFSLDPQGRRPFMPILKVKTVCECDYDSPEVKTDDSYENLADSESMEYSWNDDVTPHVPIVKRSASRSDEHQSVINDWKETFDSASQKIDKLSIQLVVGDASDPKIVSLRRKLRYNIKRQIFYNAMSETLSGHSNGLDNAKTRYSNLQSLLSTMRMDLASSTDSKYREQLLKSSPPTDEMVEEFGVVVDEICNGYARSVKAIRLIRAKHAKLNVKDNELINNN